MPKHIVDTLGSPQSVTDTLTLTAPMRLATLPSTDNSQAIADTAFVQSVQQAEWTLPNTVTISGAGNTTLSATTAQNRYLTQNITVSAGAYTATFTLSSTNARAGDVRKLVVSMPASLTNNVEIRDLTSGGTLLATVPMDGAIARTWVGYSTFGGTNWGTVSFSPKSVDEFVLARTAFRGDYLQSDGATTNRAQIYGPFDAVNNPREWIAGAASLTMHARFLVPTSNPSTNALIFSNQSNVGSGTPWAISGVFYSMLSAGGDMEFYATTNPAANGYRQFRSTTFRTTYSGQWIDLEIYFVKGTTNPVVRVNGVDISASFTLSTGGTPPEWLDAAMVPTYRLVGYNWPSGPAPIVTPILGTTSAADDAFYMATGKWPAWVVAGASNVALTNNTFTNSGYTTFSGASASGFTANETGSAGEARSVIPNFTTTQGDRYVISFTLTLNSGSAPYIGIGQFGTQYLTGGVGAANQVRAANGVNAIEVTITRGGGTYVSSAGIGFESLEASNYSVAGLTIKKLGALSLPSIQPINVVDDVSGIGTNMGYLVGMTPISSKSESIIRGTVTSTGYLYGSAGNLIPTGYQISDIWVSANGTVSLGGSAGAATEIFGTFSPESSSSWTRIIDPGSSSTGNIYATLGTATSAAFKIKVIPNSTNPNWVSNNGIVINGGLTINGSVSSPLSNDFAGHRTVGNNLILKGDSSGISGIFFQSEKDGVNINQGSDGGYIQFHPYGIDGSSGETNRFVIGTANDSGDRLVLQSAYKNDVKISFKDSSFGTGGTEYTVWHAGNHGATSGLDADLLDGQHGSYYATDSLVVHLAGTETITGAKTFNSTTRIGTTTYIDIDGVNRRLMTDSGGPITIIRNGNYAGLVLTDTTGTAISRYTASAAYLHLFTNSNGGTNYLGVDTSGNVNVLNTTASTSTTSGALIVAGGAGVAGSVNIGGSCAVTGHLSAATKAFVIPHPSKTGKRLQYACLEGPENGVYVRGKTTENVITLPEYWVNLVDSESVTVTLTPIGKFQQLYVIEQNSVQVVVGGVEGQYNYVIYGERKDVSKLETEI